MFYMLSLWALCPLFWCSWDDAVYQQRSAARRGIVCVSVTVFTVADGAQSVVVIHTLADDPPLWEHRVGADGAHIKCAPGSQQVICADVAFAASNGEVPVGQGKGGVAQHVLWRSNKGRRQVFREGLSVNELLSWIVYFLSPSYIFLLLFCLFYFLLALTHSPSG